MRPKLVAITAIGSRLILAICSPGELADLGQVQADRQGWLCPKRPDAQAVTGSLGEEPPAVQLTEILIPNGPWHHAAIRITLFGSYASVWGAPAPDPPAAETAPGLRNHRDLAMPAHRAVPDAWRLRDKGWLGYTR